MWSHGSRTFQCFDMLSGPPASSVDSCAATREGQFKSIADDRMSWNECRNIAMCCSHVTIYCVVTSGDSILLEDETGSRKAIILHYLWHSEALPL